MEFSKIKMSIVAVLMFGTISIEAQTDEAILTAFSNSYTEESNKNYLKAVVYMKSVYDADNYEINLRIAWLEYKADAQSDSEKHYRRACELRPYAVEPRLGLVYPLTAQSNWTEISTVYLKILSIDPKNTTAAYQLGMTYYYAKKYDSALFYFLKVIELYPFDYDTNLMSGWSYYMLGKNREAKIFFNKALRYKPNNAEIQEILQKL